MNFAGESVKAKDAKRTKIFIYDDNYDSVTRLDEMWKEQGFQTSTFDDDITLQEMINEMLENNTNTVLIPAIDVRFRNPIRFKVRGHEYRVRDPQSAGLEIVEHLTSTYDKLRDERYILMSSAVMEGEDLKRLKTLKKRVRNLQFVSKKESEGSILEKTYELIADPRKIAIFGYVKMFESFCDLLEIDDTMRTRIIGAEPQELQDFPYDKYIREFIERSSDAKSRISTFMAIELLLRKQYSDQDFKAVLSELKSHEGESLNQMLLSGDSMKQEYVRHYLELAVGGGV